MLREKDALKYVMLAGLFVVAPLNVPAAFATVGPPPLHVTDGTFTTGAEWDEGRPSVGAVDFPLVGNTGGATLYVEQGSVGSGHDTLWLMYDITSNPAGQQQPIASSFFDVFFQVQNDDYDVHISGVGTFTVFEKPGGTPSGVNPDGSLNLGSPWSQVTSGLDAFHAAVGFGPSPDSAAPHVMVEFDVSIHSATNPTGLYDPAPAFWSASGKNGIDPPFSSAIFTLNPDGTTTVVPVLGPDGGPVLQPVPEPGTLALLGAGLAGLGVLRRRKLRAKA